MALQFVGAKRNPYVVGRGQLHSISNYFLGSDPRHWHSRVANYSGVEYRRLYPGIRLICRGRENDPEFDWIVDPGGDVRRIRLAVRGAKPLIDKTGDLILALPDGTATLKRPTIYQEIDGTRRPVKGQYTLVGTSQVSFKIDDFDRNRPLIIDPVLVYSTYLGGSSGDGAAQIAVDGSGNIYVIGTAQSDDFPLANPLPGQSTKTGFLEAFITKFNASGSELIYSTYLGGTAPGHVDLGNGIAVDASGNAYITGQTNDLNFPTTPGAYLPAPGGGVGVCGSCGADGWVAKLNPTGSSLLFSTYLTGNNAESTPSAVAFDAAGNVYLTGSAGSGFPVTPGAYTTSIAPALHPFITKLNSTGSALVYSSYFGGNANDQAYAIALDSSDNAYITGVTTSTLDFPETTILQQPTGPLQAFVVKLNASGSELMYSTLFGAGQGLGIAVDAAENAYISGFTLSSLPTAGPMQTQFSGGPDAFVSELNPSGTGLIYSILLGGSQGTGIALDTADNAYVTGRTQTADFPTVNAIQPVYSGGTTCGYNCSDAFVTVVSADGSKFLFSTYLGDIGFEFGYGIAVDSSGSIYVAGTTSSLNFELVDPYQAVQNGDVANGGANSFVVKIASDVSVTPQRIVFGPAPLGSFQRQGLGIATAPQALTFTNNSPDAISFETDTLSGPNPSEFSISSDACAGSVVQPGGNCQIAVVFNPGAAGVRQANLELNNDAANAPFVVSLIGYGSPIVFNPPTLAFGLQTPGTTSSPQTLTITNTGQSPLSISSLALGSYDPQYFIVQNDACTGATLAGSGSCAVAIAFSPPLIGPYSAVLSVTDTASDSPQSLPITGYGTGPNLFLNNPYLNFGNQPVNSASPPQTVTLTNTGTAPLLISQMAIIGNFAQTNTCGSSVAAGGSCTVSVTFTPKASGPLSGDLTITDNATGSPQNVGLSGTGVGADFTISAAAGSSTSASVTAGQTASYSLALTPEGGFTGTASITCTGAPSEATCGVGPKSITLNGTASSTATVTVTTTAASSLLPNGNSREKWPLVIMIVGAAILLVKLELRWNNRVVRPALRYAPIVVLVAFLFVVAFAVGCGGGSSASNPVQNAGTPAGSYTLTVTGTSGSLTHSVTLQLTVR